MPKIHEDCPISPTHKLEPMSNQNHEQKALLRALDASYARSEHLLEHIAHGVVIHDVSGAIIEANSHALRMLGLSMDQLQGRTSMDSRWQAIKEDGSVFSGEDHPAMQALRKGVSVVDEVMGIYHPEAEKYVWLKVSASPRLDRKTQQVEEVIAIFEDITQEFSLVKERNRQNSLEELLIKASRRFLVANQSNADALLHETLQDFGSFLQVDRTYIFKYDFNHNTTSNTHEWCAPGISPQIEELQDVPTHLFPDWLEHHLKGEIMFVERVKSLPEDNSLRQILEPQGIQSLIAIPILSPNEECLGFVGCDAVNSQHYFHKGERDIMKLYADLIARLWLKLEMEFKLRERIKELNCIYEITRLSQQEGVSEDYMQQVVDFIPPGFLHPHQTLARIKQGQQILAEAGSVVNLGKSFELDISQSFEENLQLEVVLEAGLDFLPEEFTLLHRIVPVIEKELLRKSLKSKEREASQRLERIFQSQNTYQILIGIDGLVSLWNKLFDEHFAWSFPTVFGSAREMQVALTVHEEDHVVLAETLLSLKDSPSDKVTVNLKMRCVHQTWRIVRWEFTCLKDDDGQPTEILGVGVDETDKIIFQEDLELFKKMVDQSSAGHSFAKLDGTILYANEAMAKLHEMDLETYKSYDFKEFYPTDSSLKPDFEQKTKQLLDTGFLSNTELTFQLPNKKRRSVLSNAVILEHRGESIISISMNDITELKQSEAELEWLRNALNNSLVAIMLTDAQGKIQFVSNGITRQAGYTPKELVGKSSTILSSHRMLRAYQQTISEQLELYGNWAGEWLSRRKDGTEYWERISVTRINAKDVSQRKILVIKQDISELKQTMQSVEKQNELLKSIAWTQSHIVRAPLSRILGLVALMEDEELMSDFDEADLRKAILHSAHELDQVIREIIRQAETPIDQNN